MFVRYFYQHIMLLKHKRSHEEREEDDDDETERVAQSQHIRPLITPMMMMPIIPHLTCAVQTQASCDTSSCIQSQS